MLRLLLVAVIETILKGVPAVCVVTVPELPLPAVNVCPGKVITSFIEPTVTIPVLVDVK